MLDVMREREPVAECALSARDFRALADSIAIPWTPTNRLALMLAVGTGRFPPIEFAYEL